MESLVGQALSQFQIRDVALVHRLGSLENWRNQRLIVVASAHRAAAFDACRWLIDTLKRNRPIWKKEIFEDGAVWADGEPFPDEIQPGLQAAIPLAAHLTEQFFAALYADLIRRPEHFGVLSREKLRKTEQKSRAKFRKIYCMIR